MISSVNSFEKYQQKTINEGIFTMKKLELSRNRDVGRVLHRKTWENWILSWKTRPQLWNSCWWAIEIIFSIYHPN